MRRIILLILMAVVPAAGGQVRLEFEVASIRSAATQTAQVSAGVTIDGSQVRCSSLSLKDYIAIAYRLPFDRIVGPDWIPSERFDIAAKLPEGSTISQVPEMLQTLLEDRFQVRIHRETRELPVYALEVASGGVKIKELPPDPAAENEDGEALRVGGSGSAAGTSMNLGHGSFFTLGQTSLEVEKLAMARFASVLTRFVDRTVVDLTGLKGRYDFTLELSREDRNAMLIRSAIAAGVVLPPQTLRALDIAAGDSLTNGLKKIGLTLEPRKAPVEILVVDSSRKTPTEN